MHQETREKIDEALDETFYFKIDAWKQGFEQRKSKLVHYTSAEAACNIIKTKKFWMRQTSCMNDYSELELGLTRINKILKDKEGLKIFSLAFDSIYEGLFKDIGLSFNKYWSDNFDKTYITSLSEHLKTENDHGRLSMWRAYAKDSGVALVLNTEAFGGDQNLQLYSVPATYLSEDEFYGRIDNMLSNVRKYADLFKLLEKDILVNCITRALVFLIVSTKDPGFEEEKECRVVYFPTYEPSFMVEEQVETVNGIPQIIQSINLRNYPEHNVNHAAIPQLINRIIIGPSDYPVVIQEAFIKLLEKSGVKNADEKVVISNIPLRT